MKKLFEETNFNVNNYERFILVVDVGGENTYFAVMGVKSKKEFSIIKKYHEKTLDINISENINFILENAHKNLGITLSRGVVAGAGLVSRNRKKIKITNTNIEITLDGLKQKTMLLKYIFLNDFEAEGYGLDFLKENQKEEIQRKQKKTEPIHDNTKAIIGAGSGLGASIIYYDKQKHLHVPLPSEAGHTDFSPQNYFELELAEFIKQKNNSSNVSYETLVSGKGLENIFEFLTHKKMYEETDVVRKIKRLTGKEKLKQIDDNQQDQTCKKTIELFVKFYARMARNVALSCEPYSGLFLTGKITLKTKHQIHEQFAEEFEKHDSHKEFLQKIPLFILEDKDITLYGACNVAINFYNQI